MRILCVGLNHKTAPVSLRERLAFDAPAARLAMETLRGRYGDVELAILSTCNRTELYLARPLHGRPREEEVRDFLGRFHGVPRDDYDGSLYVHADAEAVRHLFTVAAGLDSLVPGEDQILAQVKDAYRAARGLDATGAALNELFQLAFAAAKDVRTRTGINVGKVSVASVAVDFARREFDDLAGKCVLSVGAGKMNVVMLRSLAALGAAPLLVANRSGDRAAALANECGGSPVPFAKLADALAGADVVVCSTASADPVIAARQVAAAMARRPERTMLIIDIAVPRDVDPAANDVPGVRLRNIDDLRGVVEKNLRLRSTEIDAGREIVDARVAEYVRRRHVREVAPAIESLYQHMRGVADAELAAVRNKLTGDAGKDEQLMRAAFHRALRRILHVPVSRLRDAAGTEAARRHAAVLRDLFGLGDDPPK
jgi:glutamyl-tRNA reductase